MAIGNIQRRVEGNLPTTEQAFIENAENHVPKQLDPFSPDVLKDLSENELVQRYKDIDQQSQLFKGQILLEMRSRFVSNIEFGKWCSVNFTERDSSNTGKLINLARFFQGNRSLEGIPISAAYLISAPSNKAIAEEIYSHVRRKNFKLNDIKDIISKYKADGKVNISSDEKDKLSRLEKDVALFADHLLRKTFSGKSKQFIIDVLNETLNRLGQKKV